MIIESLLIREGFYEKVFTFSNHNNLVYSKNNSRGKTTLLRLLLYSLGYSIPSTQRFIFKNCTTEVKLITDSGKDVIVVRPSSDYVVLSIDDVQRTICLPDDKNQLDKVLFEISNDLVLNNLLGTFYLDQEKGWTLLNRGTVIGSIHFNIEELIQGLSNRDCSELKEQEIKLNRELTRYLQVSNVKKYRESLDKESGSIITERFDNEIDVSIAQKQLELNDVKTELSRIDRVLRDNRQVRSYVEDLKLRVRMPNGESLLVTPERVIDLDDSIDFLIAKRRIKAAENRQLSNELNELIRKKQNLEEPSVVNVESITDIFDSMVLQLPLTQVDVESAIENLRDEIKRIRDLIVEVTRKGNDVVTSLHGNIVKYASELGIERSIYIAESYLFTSNLKVLSGALLHKIVFSFRLAYIQEIKNRYGIRLPIILDSPSGKELDQDNIQLMMRILNRDFSDHQLIIASIRSYDLPELNRIELQSMLMEDATIMEA